MMDITAQNETQPTLRPDRGKSTAAAAPYDRVMVALDYDDPYAAFTLVDEIGDRIDWFKVGPMLFTRSGNEIIDFLHLRSKKIFLDLKLFDTPRAMRDTVRQLGDLGVRYATVHCLGGQRMLEAAAMGCRGTDLRLLGITLLTSQTAEDLSELGWENTESGMVSRLVDLARERRLSGVLCAPQELADARARTVPGFELVSAGIRIPGEEVYQDDQQRTASPTQALAWGADYLIIGRPLTQAREPRAVLDRLFEQS